jgi:hypothetical protein
MKRFLVSLRTSKGLRNSLQTRIITIEEANKIVVVASVSSQAQLDWLTIFTNSLLKDNAGIQPIVFFSKHKLSIPEALTGIIRIDRVDFLWTGKLKTMKQQELPTSASLLINLTREDDPYANYIVEPIESELKIGVNMQNLSQTGRYDLVFSTANWNSPEMLAKEISSYLRKLKGD